MSRIPNVPASLMAKSRPLRQAALVLLVVATLLAGWLVHLALATGPVAGCDAGNCGLVLGSKWAKVFGVPVGLLGGASYLILAILGAKPIPAAQRAMRIAAAALVLLIPAAALWFVALQVFVIHAFCPWCCTTHAVASLGAVLLAMAWRNDVAGTAGPATANRKGARPSARPATVWGPAMAAAAAGFAAFLGAQALSPEPPKPRLITASMNTPAPAVPRAVSTNGPVAPTPTTPTAAGVVSNSTTPGAAVASTNEVATGPRRIRLHEGRFILDPTAYPVNGSPDAEQLMVMISDYTCPHCRAAYKILKEVREVFDGRKLGVVMLPSHHGGDSQELQMLMLSAWRAEPSVWAEVSSDLYLEHLPLRPDTVRQVLTQRLGPGRLEGSLEASRPWIQTVFDTAKNIHAANRAKAGSGSIPQFVIGQEIVVGAPEAAGDLFALLDRNLGLVRDRYPVLSPERTEVELGRVFAGTGPTVVLGYTNTGLVALQVSRATLPPGARTLKGLPATVEPGSTGVVEVAVPVPREPGPFDQLVKLHSNARVPEQAVRIKGTAWRPLRIEPAILDFGRIDLDSEPPGPAVMHLTLDEPARVAQVASQHPGFQVTLREVEAERKYDLVVQPTKSLNPGNQQASLVVTMAKPVPAGWPETMVFAARAVAERAVTVVPPRILMPPGPLPRERHHQILVRCTDGTPGFAGVGAVIEGGPAFAQPEILPGTRTNEFTVRLTLPAGWELPTPPVESKVVVRTSHPRVSTVEVPMVPQGR